MGKTVGTKELLLLFCILLFCLLLAVFYAENFPSVKNDISSSVDSSSSSIDYDYYHKYEDKMVDAAKEFVKKTNYKISDAIISIELETLVNASSIDVLYDKKTDKKCTGYVVISSNTDYKGYLQCDEYKTVG